MKPGSFPRTHLATDMTWLELTDTTAAHRGMSSYCVEMWARKSRMLPGSFWVLWNGQSMLPSKSKKG